MPTPRAKIKEKIIETNREQALRDAMLFNLTVHVRAIKDLIFSLIDVAVPEKEEMYKKILAKHEKDLINEMKNFGSKLN